MSRRTWIVMLLALVLVASVAYWQYRAHGVSASVDERDLITVARVDYPVLVSAPGILEAAKSVSIGAPKIQREHRFKLSRMVEEGKAVSDGDFLLEFDGSDISRRLRDETANFQRVQEEYQKKRSDFDIQMRDLKLQLEQAKSDYEKLENMLSRQADLESAIVIEETRIKRDTAKKKVELLQNKIKYVDESGRLDLEISRSNEQHYRNRMDNLLDAMDSLTVTAPVSGVVIFKRDWNNEARQVGSYVDIMQTVLEIPDLSTIRAKVQVDEIDAGKVKVGHDAQIQVDAVQGRVLRGRVSAISSILKQATYDRPQKVAETFIELLSEDLEKMRPQMSVRASIQVGRYNQAIVIPMSSIHEREGRSFVQLWKPDAKTFDWREVQLISNDGLSAVLKSGLDANDKIRAKPKV